MMELFQEVTMLSVVDTCVSGRGGGDRVKSGSEESVVAVLGGYKEREHR